MFISRKYGFILASVITLLITLIFLVYPRQYPLSSSIRSDFDGTYSYLVAAIVYSDVTAFDKIIEAHKKSGDAFQNFIVTDEQGNKINKYFLGVAILIFPFFFAAHLFSYILGYDPNGYSFLYQIATIVSCMFYVLMGTYFLIRVLSLFFSSARAIIVSVFLTLFTTNITYYLVVDTSSLTHVYQFFLINASVYYFLKVVNERKIKYWVLLGFLLGLITISRPTDLIILLFFPFFFNTGKEFFGFFALLKWNKVLTSLIVFLSVVSIQLFYYYLQTGSIFAWSYQGEGFTNWENPQIENILFSYSKGIFVYIPILFVATISSICWLLKKNYWKFFTWVIFFLLNTYLISSWHMWTYGCSYSIRPYIDFLITFSIPLAMLLELIFSHDIFGKKIVCSWSLLTIIVTVFMYYNHIGMLQIVYYIKDCYDKTDKIIFWKTFFTANKKYTGYSVYRQSLGAEKYFITKELLNYNFDMPGDSVKNVSNEVAFSPPFSCNNYFRDSISFDTLKNFTNNSTAINFQAWVLLIDPNAEIKLIAEIKNDEGIIYYYSENSISDQLFPLQWQGFSLVTKLPAGIKNTDRLHLSIWSPSEATFYIDDVKLLYMTKN